MSVASRAPLRTRCWGDGPPLLLLHGYGMLPETYGATASLLARRGWRVVAPDLFSVRGRWTARRCADGVAGVADRLGTGPMTVVGHSFGGAIQLDLAVSRPDLVRRLVFTDTMGLSRQWVLAAHALRPVNLFRLATPQAAISFGRAWSRHPSALVRGAWWGFRSDRREAVRAVAASGVPVDVLWAERDTLLNRREGEAFARDLGARFTVVRRRRGGGPLDHDWMFRHPSLFAAALERIGVRAADAGVEDDERDWATGAGG